MTVGDTLRPVLRPRLYEQVVSQIQEWIGENRLEVGDRLPPERELASRLGVSRATVSQALVAMEVVGIVSVRHGDGVILVEPVGSTKIVNALRRHAQQLPEIIEAREALEAKLAALAAVRRTEADLAAIDEALELMERDIAAGGRGVEGDERFHAAVTAAGHSGLLGKVMAEISDLIKETRIASLAQPDRPLDSLRGHRKVADAIRARDPEAAAQAMQDHIAVVSDVALLRAGGDRAVPGGTGGES
jgi:GntR family transcriptional regulator, transcriptional repressor for pyruvate dehydrogenase complex